MTGYDLLLLGVWVWGARACISACLHVGWQGVTFVVIEWDTASG
jgi:hypothetical protein